MLSGAFGAKDWRRNASSSDYLRLSRTLLDKRYYSRDMIPLTSPNDTVNVRLEIGVRQLQELVS